MLVEKNTDIIFAIFLYVYLDQHMICPFSLCHKDSDGLMPKMAPPNTFSDPLEKWVYRQRVDSVVFIEFRPDAALVLDRWNAVHPLEGDLVAQEEEENRRAQLSAQTMIGTGSFIVFDGYGAYVLTCAHLMAPVFNQDMPITCAEVNQLYQPFILCQHREQRFQDGIDDPRLFRRGIVDFVSCENDLMVVRIPRYLMNVYCDRHHGVQTFAARIPRSVDKVVMISWPGYGRSMTAALGTFSNQSRLIADLGDENVFGFPITLYEVGIISEDGSSGGPMYNGEAHTAGVLHGGNGRFSYFIRLEDIVATLTNWGLILPQA